MEENKLTEEQIKHQQEVDKVKEALLESIRLKDPKLYYRMTHKDGYRPWTREDYFNSDITAFTNKQADRPTSVTHINRNDLCKCGSGKKVKRCCGIKTYYTIPKLVKNEQK